jgi:hypothetical protein
VGADYDRLLRLDPDYPYARGNRLFCRLQPCDWQGLDQTCTIAPSPREGWAQCRSPLGIGMRFGKVPELSETPDNAPRSWRGVIKRIGRSYPLPSLCHNE